MSSGPETPKKVYKASESVNVGCCRLCKSVEDTGNLGEIFTAKPESTLAEAEELLYGDALPLCEFLPRLLCRPRERRPNNFRVVRSTISESQVSFLLKVKRYIERGVVLRAAYAQKFEGQERIIRDRKCVWKPQSPRTKFRINAINSNQGYFVLVLQRFFRKGFPLLIE